MFLLQTSKWALMHTIRQPLHWLLVAACACTWPLLKALSPTLLTVREGLNSNPSKVVALLGLLAGQFFAMAMLQRMSWFLSGIRPTRRLCISICVASACSATPLLAGAAAAAVVGAPGPPWPAVLLAHLQLCGVGMLLLRTPLSTHLQLAVLPLLVWVLPALTAPTGRAGAFIWHTFAVGRHFSAESPADRGFAHWVVALLPIIGLYLALILSTPSTQDALRRSR